MALRWLARRVLSAKLPQRSELTFAANSFNSIEINGAHYSLQRPEYFAHRAEETPDNFIFAIKGSRFITHMKRLRDVEDALANFSHRVYRVSARSWADTLAVSATVCIRSSKARDILQNATADDEASSSARWRTWAEAAWPGAYNSRTRNHKAKDPALRRNSAREFCYSGVHQLLRRHSIGSVVADTVEWPLLMDVTTDFVYCRLHGSEQLYASGYGDVALDVWADRVVAWTRGCDAPNDRFAGEERCQKIPARDVYVYFDNDMKGVPLLMRRACASGCSSDWTCRL
jgi:uncharacterized protein YecE (DUF72 family)